MPIQSYWSFLSPPPHHTCALCTFLYLLLGAKVPEGAQRPGSQMPKCHAEHTGDPTMSPGSQASASFPLLALSKAIP